MDYENFNMYIGNNPTTIVIENGYTDVCTFSIQKLWFKHGNTPTLELQRF